MARRTFRSHTAPPRAPIATLHYIRPVIDELIAQPLEPGYLSYIRYKLATVAPEFVTAATINYRDHTPPIGYRDPSRWSCPRSSAGWRPLRSASAATTSRAAAGGVSIETEAILTGSRGGPPVHLWKGSDSHLTRSTAN